VQKVTREARGRIAPLRAIDLVHQTLNTPYALGAPLERRTYLDLMASDASRALRHLFLAERAVRKVPGLERAKPLPEGPIGIIGVGTMGAGIAANLLEHGFAVILAEGSDAALQAGRERLATLMARAIRSGRIAESQRHEIARRVTFASDLAILAAAPLVIEAIADERAAKAELIGKLETLLPPAALIATTSTLHHEALAEDMAHPERFLGIHFFSPAPVMRLIEVVRTRRTGVDAMAAALTLARRLDKIAVVCAPCEGLIGNRILTKFRAQCDFMLEEGALPDQIDRALEAFGIAIGPFAAQDLAGLDIAWARRKRLAEARNPSERGVPLIDRLCEQGRFGQKAGKGWYLYRDGKREPDPEVAAMIRLHATTTGRRQSALTPEAIQARVLAAMVNEGAKLVSEGIVERPHAIDLVMVHGYGFPAWRGGPMQEADARGLRAVLAQAETNANRDGPAFAVAPLLPELLAEGRNFASLNASEANRAFSSKVDTGLREENAIKQKDRANEVNANSPKAR
jgi:3-hydroxyacyl-CoA dehydrogenase